MKYLLAYIFVAFCVFPRVYAQKINSEFRNFYGISWRGTPHENLLYAKQMGYKYVFYQKGMEIDPLSDGMNFYIESPEYLIYNRGIDRKRNYTPAQLDFYTKFCRIVDNGNKFPNNLATGWHFNDDLFSAQLDFQKKEVVKWAIDEILLRIKAIQSSNSKFHFAGFAWDVPQLSGDFWSRQIGTKQLKQVKANFWKQKADFGADTVNKFVSYEEGHFYFYKDLFSLARRRFKDLKVIMEPSRIFEDWLSQLEKFDNYQSISPDILCQEGKGDAFITDHRIFKNRLLQRENLMSTSPSYYLYSESMSIACQAASVGSWFCWFGRFGGTAGAPDYKSIKEVPSDQKLLRVLCAWENLNEEPLANRKWDGHTYFSAHAIVNKNVISISQPHTNKVFVLLRSGETNYKLPENLTLNKIFVANDLLQEETEISFRYIRSDSIKVKSNFSGKVLILHFNTT